MIKIIFNYLSTGILLTLGKISSYLSISQRAKIGILLGEFFKLTSNSKKKLSLNNLKLSYPEKDKKELLKIVSKSYHNLGINLIELFTFPYLDDEDLLKYISYQDLSELKKLFESFSNGAIILSGHFSNWELMAFIVGYLTKIKVTIVTKPQTNYVFDKIVNKYRCLRGNKVIPMDKAAKTLIDCIKNKEMVGLLVDQSADPNKDIFVEFLGRPAVTYEAPAKLCLKFKIPLIFILFIRQENFTYKVYYHIIEYNDLIGKEDAIEKLTKRHVNALEKIINQYPEQWVWQHNRWKYNINEFSHNEKNKT